MHSQSVSHSFCICYANYCASHSIKDGWQSHRREALPGIWMDSSSGSVSFQCDLYVFFFFWDLPLISLPSVTVFIVLFIFEMIIFFCVSLCWWSVSHLCNLIANPQEFETLKRRRSGAFCLFRHSQWLAKSLVHRRHLTCSTGHIHKW